MLSYQTLGLTVRGKIFKKSYKNNKFKISALGQNEGFELHDGSYSVSNILDCFKFILNKIKQKIKLHLK